MREISAHFLKNDNGVYLYHDPAGALNKNDITNNAINGFDNGLVVGGISSVDGIVIQNCNTAILNNFGVAVGNVLVSNCPTLLAPK